MRDAKTNRRSQQALFLALFGALLCVLGLQACTAGRPDAAGGLGSVLGMMDDGPCVTDGTKRACHVETGRVEGIVNCFSGTQTCMNGAWGPCGGDTGEGTISSLNYEEIVAHGREGGSSGSTSSASGLKLLLVTASDASYDNPSCKSNPCNPYCRGIEVDADKMVPDGGFSEYATNGTVSGPDSFPGGLSGPKNAMGTFASNSPPANVACTQGHPPADGKVCSSDYCCAAYPVGTAANTCQPWAVVGGTNPVAEEKCTKATGVDFQLGLACNSTDGHVHVPLCNRGTADATTGSVMVAEYPGNPEYSGDLGGGGTDYCNNAGDPSAYCMINLATKKLPAGKCIDVDVTAKTAAGTSAGVTCTSGFSSGNRTMAVNPVARPTYAWAKTFSPAYTTLPEGDVCNNYSFHPSTAQGGTCSAYGEQPPPPQSVCFDYEALCNPGFRIVWNQLAYSTQVPTDSQVLFHVSSSKAVDGGASTYSTQVLAADVRATSSPDPAICAMSGSPDANACPKNLATLLGEPANHNEFLKVCVTQIAVTAIPVVLGWQVTFNCVPYE
jgi:hypothetical protein